uniref:F-box/LRR-repeat protein 15/At3g58940/PEG3-like LRR domain-containing protein n=1 Tax=Oryza meridionalis TaxID=40149 RepID=A0A0E0ESQ1_9ORYZ
MSLPPDVLDGVLTRLGLCDALTARRAHDWILVLARRGVESLDLASPIHNHLAVHSSVFSCDRLAYLSLFACDIPPLPPGFAGFPNLRSLTLGHVWLRAGGEYQLEEIIEKSPLLEMLVLSGIFIDGDDIINWITDNEQKVEANGVFQNAEWTGGMCANLQIAKQTVISCSDIPAFSDDMLWLLEID